MYEEILTLANYPQICGRKLIFFNLFINMKKVFEKPQSLATATKSQTVSRRIFAPGNRFALDICQYLEFTPVWEMPKIQAVDVESPKEIIAFYRNNESSADNVWCHFYTDDSRLMPFLTEPYRMVRNIMKFPAMTGIDLSIKPEMPLIMQLTVSFNNKLITAFWQHMGLTVVQNVVWASPATYDICFDGYAKHAMVAVNSTGVGRDKRSGYLWDQGYEAMLEYLQPSLIIRYGAKRPDERTDISIYFENDNKKSARYGWQRKLQ